MLSTKLRDINRRKFLSRSLGAATALTLTSRLGLAQTNAPNQHKICVFTKPLQSLSYDELADRMAEIGVDGIEAPVRTRGHIEPQDVEEELPKLVAALQQRGLEISVLSSSINSVDSPHAETTLKSAAKLGISYYRMAYYRYDLKRPIMPQLRNFEARMKDLAQMNESIGITGVYQNHSGAHNCGAPLWDLYYLLVKCESESVGTAWDLAHATIEGGRSWPLQLQLLRATIRAAFVKDFRWKGKQLEWVPLGEGRTDPNFYKTLADDGFAGPLSVHVEYFDHQQDVRLEQYLAAMKSDVATLRSWLLTAESK